MNIVIAGAGIGGLTAALCLHKAGHQVSIVEQSSVFSEIGAGLQCGANALHVLEYLGLMPALEAVAVAPQAIQFREYRSGKSLYNMELGQEYADKYGAPYLHVHRADLQTVLLDAIAERNAAKIKMGAVVCGFEETPSSVSLLLENDEHVDADCLIAADGIRSVIRDQLLGKQSPRFTGNVAWRGVVAVENLQHEWMDTIASNFIGPNKHAVTYYLRQQKLANFVAVVENSSWTDDSWVTNAPWAELKQDFAGWHPVVQSIIDAMDKQQCYRWALYDHQPFNNWSSGRVTLLGDAAHATLPFMASGAALAIEDARVLERALTQATSLADGLQLYQRNRMPRTARVQNASARLGRLYHLNSSLLQKAAFKAMSLVAPSQEAFLPDYNANTVELV